MHVRMRLPVDGLSALIAKIHTQFPGPQSMISEGHTCHFGWWRRKRMPPESIAPGAE